MILTSLSIRNFRNVAQADLRLDKGFNLFTGLNAQGKTSVVESVLFLATSLSHRTRREEEMIRWGEETAFLRGMVESNGEETKLECGIEKNRKVIKVDGVVLPRVGDLYGKLRVVLFAPEDLEIVNGGPQSRRRFLDMAVAQLDPAYIPLLQRFKKSLKQRNHLLKRMRGKSTPPALAELSVWDSAYIEHAAGVVQTRLLAAQALDPLVREVYAGLADDGPFTLAYSAAQEPDLEKIRQTLTQRLEKNRAVDVERGSTHAGPHRDDLRLQLGGRDVQTFGSQGQRRTAALALRMAEARWCRMKTGSTPLLLIDDVVYEMDNNRREKFWSLMDLSGQAVVTATDRRHLGIKVEPSLIYQVNNGEICPV